MITLLGSETGLSHLEVEVSAVRPPSKGQTPSCQALPAGNNDDDEDEDEDEDEEDDDDDEDDDGDDGDGKEDEDGDKEH